ncbi:uncharacterized protein ATC70_002058 [Mucor velutinosus]|uniref:Endonuclease/exonuclease/phosphatase domain-containing protein n=1 Tax=Mucor velutinosus TaxID=708070 RepID=A0AAN7I039_9FUNG|nr:hypothetical protein ATC70_002058 [Mucor velutinosus]
MVAKKRKLRLRAIANRVGQEQYDLVALQEVWMWEDFDYIKERARDVLPYTKYFHSGTLGSGLAILSRFPILSSSYLKFTLAGKPLKVFQGDFYVGKGCGSVCIDHPEVGLIDVYTTHAGYGNHDDYQAQRITECWQIANSVRVSAAQGRHVILAGDFNSIPTSHCYQILKNHAFMTDSWLEMHKDTMADSLGRLERDQLTASECIQLFGITCDSPLNTWTKHLLKQQPYAKDIGDRLDYIFYRRTPEITCQQSRVAFEEYMPNTQMSYSDHFAVHSIFLIAAKTNSVFDDGYAPLSKEIARPDFTHILPDSLYPIVRILERDLLKATSTANGLLFLFGLSVLIVFCLYSCQIAVPFYFAESQLTVLASSIVCGLFIIVFSVVAIVSLIVGFVFGRNEQRSLRQYLIDMNVCLDNLHEAARRESLAAAASPSSLHSSTTSYSTSDGLVIKQINVDKNK